MFQMRCMCFLQRINGYQLSFLAEIKFKTSWVDLKSWPGHHSLILGLALLAISVILYQVSTDSSVSCFVPYSTFRFSLFRPKFSIFFFIFTSVHILWIPQVMMWNISVCEMLKCLSLKVTARSNFKVLEVSSPLFHLYVFFYFMIQ